MNKNLVKAISIITIGLGAWAGLDYRHKVKSGYCFVEKRLITDEELVNVAVTHLLNNLEKEYQSLPPEEQAKRVRYKGLKDFYERQPICCGNSGNNGRSKYPPPPRTILYKNKLFARHILYQHLKDGEYKYRGVSMMVSLCGDRPFVHHNTSNEVDYLWSIGRPSKTDPDSKSRTKNIHTIRVSD